MPNQVWSSLLFSNYGVDGPSLSASTTATSILPAGYKYTIPSNFFQSGGQILRIKAGYRVSNIVTTPGTLTLDLRFGSTVVWTSGALQLSTTAHNTEPVWLEVDCQFRPNGATAALFCFGRAFGQPLNISSADSTTTHTILMAPNTTPAVGNTFDPSVTQQVDHFGTFSVNNAANLIQLHHFAGYSDN